MQKTRLKKAVLLHCRGTYEFWEREGFPNIATCCTYKHELFFMECLQEHAEHV